MALGIHFNVEDAMPRDDKIVGLASVAGVFRMGYSANILGLEGKVSLYPRDSLFVSRSCALLVSRATGCLVIYLACWHLRPPTVFSIKYWVNARQKGNVYRHASR